MKRMTSVATMNARAIGSWTAGKRRDESSTSGSTTAAASSDGELDRVAPFGAIGEERFGGGVIAQKARLLRRSAS